MNNQTFNPKAIEATAKATFDNATQVIDLVMDKSTKLVERNVAAAKATVARHTAYANTLRGVTGVEEFVKAQESIGKTEAEAIEQFSRDIYNLSSQAAAELTKVNDSNRTSASELVNESLENAVAAIPNGSDQPYGSFFKDLVKTQINTFNAFNSFIEQAVETNRANYDTLAGTFQDAATVATTSAKKASTAKRK